MNSITKVSREHKLMVETVVLDCLDKAQRKFGVHKVTKIPEIRYTTKGSAAGWACWNWGEPYIGINPILLNENPDEMINVTVPHEVAHIVTEEVWNGHPHKAHGKEWAYVMNVFGLKAERCHKMDVSTIRRMRGGEHIYRCSCRTHSLGKIKHNRIKRDGVVYRCKHCRSDLVYEKTLTL